MAKVIIRNDEPEGAAGLVQVTVVTVGEGGARDQQQVLGAGQQIEVQVGVGQFLQVDTKEG